MSAMQPPTPAAGHPPGNYPEVGRSGLAVRVLARHPATPGTSSLTNLRENVTGAGLTLSDEDLAELDKIGNSLQRDSAIAWRPGTGRAGRPKAGTLGRGVARLGPPGSAR